ncbi:hypothetical protein MBLNU230_g3994t1 [Neophaeotheca triangularis]
MPTTTVTTTIDSSIDHQVLLAIMHNHETMIDALAPGNSARELVSGDPAGNGPVVYSVTAPTPIGTNMTYPLTLTNKPDGVDSVVEPRPPMGQLKITAQWRIKGDKLQEDVEIEGNFLTKKVAKGNVEKNHPEQHQTLLKQAAA